MMDFTAWVWTERVSDLVTWEFEKRTRPMRINTFATNTDTRTFRVSNSERFKVRWCQGPLVVRNSMHGRRLITGSRITIRIERAHEQPLFFFLPGPRRRRPR